MALENQIHQIDLSQDASWNQLDDSFLTSQEKELLAKQFQEETQGIIYLTQQELSDFQDILKSELPEIVSAELSDFTQEQKMEGLSSSDILTENEILSSEDIDKLDIQTQEILFGNGGVFEGMDISQVAQDHMSVALSLSIIQQISNTSDITAEDILSMISGENENFLGILEEKISGLRELVSGIIHQENDMDANSLEIANNGERNYLFMQTEKGIDFFNSLFSGELDADQIEVKIESENMDVSEVLPEGIVNNLSGIRIAGNENINGVTQQVQGAIETATPQQVRIIREQIQNPEAELTGIAKFIHDLLKSIFDAIGSFDIGDEDNDESNNPIVTPATENLPEQNSDLSSQLQEIRVPGLDLGPLLSNGESIAQIQSILEDIDPETTAQQEYESLFGSENKFTQISTIFQNNNNTFPVDLSHADRFMTILKTYNTYRNDPEVAGKDQGRPTWNAWSLENDWSQN